MEKIRNKFDVRDEIDVKFYDVDAILRRSDVEDAI